RALRERRRRGELPDGRHRPAARPAARAALLPDHALVPLVRPAGRGPAAVQVDHRLRAAGADRRVPGGRVAGPGSGHGPDRRGQREYPGEAGRPGRGARPRVRLSLAGTSLAQPGCGIALATAARTGSALTVALVPAVQGQPG